MLFSARPRRLALVTGLCAGVFSAAATAGILAAADALHADSPRGSASPASIVRRTSDDVSGAGSGVVVDARSLVLTNEHVATPPPGSAAGASLLDTSERLVGITTFAATAGAAEDIGFAVEAAQALALIERATH